MSARVFQARAQTWTTSATRRIVAGKENPGARAGAKEGAARSLNAEPGHHGLLREFPKAVLLPFQRLPKRRNMPAIVTAVSRSTSHTFSKPNEPMIRLVAGLGIEGGAKK